MKPAAAPPPARPVNVVFLCTGNAARSVMATIVARSLGRHELTVWGAGTHSIEGLPMSVRTRKALKNLGLSDPSHRSHQFNDRDARIADVVVAFEPGNVEYIRRVHPQVAARAATIVRLSAHLEGGDAPLADRLAALGLDGVALETWEEVVDPAGGDQPIFDACVKQVDELVRGLVDRLGEPGRADPLRTSVAGTVHARTKAATPAPVDARATATAVASAPVSRPASAPVSRPAPAPGRKGTLAAASARVHAPGRAEESVCLLVPVKAFARAKFRLAPVIDPQERRRLAQEMATHVVSVAAPMPVAIVCDDDEVAEWATSVGAQVIWTPGQGLNGAVSAGVAFLGREGFANAIVAHSDLPLAAGFSRLGNWPGVTLVPDRHRAGTNVVGVPTGLGFTFAYGPSSYARHTAEAVRLGRGLRVVHQAALAWDVDFPDDLDFPPAPSPSAHR